MVLPQRVNQRWSLDFLSDALSDSRRFRILAVVDDFTRECLCLVADTSLSGMRLARELDAIAARRGYPKLIVSDNGSELTSVSMLRRQQECQVEWHSIAPGKPTQSTSGLMLCAAFARPGGDDTQRYVLFLGADENRSPRTRWPPLRGWRMSRSTPSEFLPAAQHSGVGP
jgi:hypothetical protein